MLCRNCSKRIAEVVIAVKMVLKAGKRVVDINPQDIGFAGEIVEKRRPGDSCASGNVIDTGALIPLFEEEFVGSILQCSQG
jgi:hypothetical protein